MTQSKINSFTGTSVNFPVSKQLKYLAKALLKNGDEIRLVGGCVRDFLMKRKISDIDLACKYKPLKVIKLLEQNNIKVIPTGIKHGTVTAIIDGINFEITTLRKDSETFGRSAKVEFVDDYYLDAKRRDFTINAMSIDFSFQLYDYFNGQEDLKNNVVKFIGDAAERIREDYLRILRFFRFSCRYANSLDEEGLKAAIKFKDHINNLSADRIRNELINILSCDNDDKLSEILSIMQENGLFVPILTGDYFDLQYFKNLLILEKKLNRKCNYLVKFAALIYSHKSQSKLIAKKLNFSNKETKHIDFIANPKFTVDLNLPQNRVISLLMEYESKDIIDAMIINMTTLEINPQLINDFLKSEKILLQSEKPKFPINGHDLLRINIEQEKIKEALTACKEFWIKNNFNPNAEEIIDFVKKKLNQFITKN